MSSVQDPQFTLRLTCDQCSHSMGDLRVHYGTGSSPEHRGRVVQSCSKARCHWTCYHTKASYIIDDAEAFVKRYNARRIGAVISPDIANVPLRRSTVTEAPDPYDKSGNIHCQNPTCRTQAGNRTRGSQQCIEFKCKRCCGAAALDAGDAHEPRDTCKAHGVAVVSDHQYLLGVAGVPAAPLPHPAPVPPPHRANPRVRALAQPIGPLWRATHQSADEVKAVADNLKTRRLEMEAREKRTCELVIYHKSGVMPLVVSEYIDTYPRLQLSSLPDLLAGLNLAADARLDHWSAGCWKTIQIASIMTVENDRRTLLKLRPSLLEEMPLAECVGLAEELKRQSPVQGKKRASDADDSGSPLSKTAKPHNVTDAAQAAHVAADGVPAVPGVSVASPLLPNGPPRSISTVAPVVAQQPARATTSQVSQESRWIQNLSVSQYESGWRKVRELQDSGPRFRSEKSAFPQIFGHEYHKSTVNKYKTLWNSDACKALRGKYVDMGEVSGASMAHLLHEMKTYRSGPEELTFHAPQDEFIPTVTSQSPLISPAPIQDQPIPSMQLPASVSMTTQPMTPEQRRGLGSLHQSSRTDPRPAPELDTPLRPAFPTMVDIDLDALDSGELDGIALSFGSHPQYLDLPPLEGLERRFEDEIESILEDPSASDYFMQAEERRNNINVQPFAKSIEHFGASAYNKISKVVEDFAREREPDMEAASYAPLSFEDFIVEVLVPEVQTLLIAESLNFLPPAQFSINPSNDTTPPADDPFLTLSPLSTPLNNYSELHLLTTATWTPIKAESRDEDRVGVDVDPETLCSFCDEALPPSPSADLLLLRARMYAISVPDSLPENTGHRRPTSMSNVQGYCELHRMERDVLPLAIAGNWPFQPKFDVLLDRVLALGPSLTALCEELENSSFFRESKEHYSSPPGAEPVSMSRMLSVGQQYSSSHRLQAQGAGYYGEIGYEIIIVALRFMFPDGCDLDLYAPLPYNVVLPEVLLPEAVVRLIQEDLKMTPRAAKLVASSSYIFGVTQHPSSVDSPALAAAIQYTTRIEQRAKSAYRLWVSSGTSLGLSAWVDLQKVKLEGTEVLIPPPLARTGGEPVVIDLTGSDDET